MYFPYLRGRQNELLALNELAHILSQSNKVLPIVEPIRANNGNAYRSLLRSGVPFILVVNPTVGRLVGAAGQASIENQFINGALNGSTNYFLGVIITANTPLADIEHYSNRYPNHKKVFIHKANYSNLSGLLDLTASDPSIKLHIFSDNRTSASYRDNFRAYSRVLLKDGFVKSASNGAYGDSDFFCDIHSTYARDGYDGFGDYLTIGDEFKEGGMTPLVIAIHMAYLDGDIHMGHFLSDPTSESRADPGGKFSEALANLINFVNTNGMASQTLGIREFEDLHDRQHYPGLGQIKKISMKHHIEFIIRQI